MKTQLDNHSLSLLGKLALIQTLADKAQVEVDQLIYCREFQSSNDDEEIKRKLNKIAEFYNGICSLTSDAMSEASTTYLETKTRK